MPRRRKRGRGRGGFTIPLAPIIGLAAGVAPAVEAAMSGNFEGAVNHLKYAYLGLDSSNNFNVGYMAKGLLPLVLGIAVHKFVGGAPLNFNQMLARAKVPLIRL